MFHHSFSLGKKSSCVISVKEGNFVSAEMTWETTYSGFSYLWLFFWNTLRWMELFLKHSKLKCSQKLFQIRTIHTLLLFCSQSEDRSTISSGSPTAQTGNRKSKKNSEKSDQNVCLLICPVKRGEPLSHLCVWHWCVWEFTQSLVSP